MEAYIQHSPSQKYAITLSYILYVIDMFYDLSMLGKLCFVGDYPVEDFKNIIAKFKAYISAIRVNLRE